MTPAQTAPAAAGPSNPARMGNSSLPANPESDRLHAFILDSLEDDQAIDTVSIPLEGKSSIADFMVIASGRSTRQVAAIATKLAERLKHAGFGTPRIEGLPAADWVLIDAGDVIVHLFRPEVRSFYNLERMWGFGDESASVAGSA